LQLLQLVLSEQSTQLVPQLEQDERVELTYWLTGQTQVLVGERMKGELQLVQLLALEQSWQ
jgi:hypothetical protein